jgi:trigger factor
MEEFRAKLREEAFKKVKTRLLVKAVAEAEGIAASEEEIEKELADMAAMYNMPPDKLKESMGASGRRLLGEDVRNRKTVEFLFANADIEKEGV